MSGDDRLWALAAALSRGVERDAPTPCGEAEALADAMPPIEPGERVADWLDRASALGPALRFSRFAAADAEFDAEPPPLPSMAMISDDGRLRLAARVERGRVIVELRALGRAVAELAGARLALVDGGVDVAETELDAMGRGVMEIADEGAARRALARPRLRPVAAE